MQANAIKFFSLPPERAKKISKISNRFWLAGILFGIANGILEVRSTLSSHVDDHSILTSHSSEDSQLKQKR